MHAPVCNVPELSRAIAELRDAGVRIALDDVGLGQSNYRMMLDCNPEYFKLDAYFVRGVKDDPKRRAVVESVVTFGRALRSSVVAEGAESMEDIAILAGMGVEFVQCNLLCPAVTLDKVLAADIVRPSETTLVPSCDIAKSRKADGVSPSKQIPSLLSVSGVGKSDAKGLEFVIK